MYEALLRLHFRLRAPIPKTYFGRSGIFVDDTIQNNPSFSAILPPTVSAPSDGLDSSMSSRNRRDAESTLVRNTVTTEYRVASSASCPKQSGEDP